jgi:hypothetical protein
MIRVGIVECLLRQRRLNRAAGDRADKNERSHERTRLRGFGFDALFVGAFDKTMLGRKIRRFLDQENSSGEAASWVAGDIVSEWCEDQYTNVLA